MLERVHDSHSLVLIFLPMQRSACCVSERERERERKTHSETRLQ
jgi:hypothetical protein